MHYLPFKARVSLGLVAVFLIVASGFAGDGDDDRISGQSNSESSPDYLSSHLSKAIIGSMPKYSPPAPKTEKKKEEDDSDVLVLAPVIVTEKRPPKSGWDMLNENGKGDYLRKHYPGATIPGAPLTDLIPNYAKVMQKEDQRLVNLKQLEELADMNRATGNTKELKELRNELLDAQIRPHDWQAESMDRSYNNDRR